MFNKIHGRVSLRKGLVFAALGALSLGGCTMYQPSYAPTPMRNKITVAETVERLELYVQPSGLNLSARDQDALGNFIYQYSRSGQGPLYLNLPENAVSGLGVKQAQTAIGSQLASLGIPNSAVQTGQYATAPNAPAPVVVSFRRLTTAPIACRQGGVLTHTSTNQPYGGFGCSQTANLAAMINDPRQLLAPYEVGNSSMTRRMTVMDKYGAGEETASQLPAKQNVTAGSK